MGLDRNRIGSASSTLPFSGRHGRIVYDHSIARIRCRWHAPAARKIRRAIGEEREGGTCCVAGTSTGFDEYDTDGDGAMGSAPAPTSGKGRPRVPGRTDTKPRIPRLRGTVHGRNPWSGTGGPVGVEAIGSSTEVGPFG